MDAVDGLDFDFDLAGLDFDFDFDVDLDLEADEFRHAYSAFVATAADSTTGKSCGAPAGGWIAGFDEGTGETSPRSGVTDDPLAEEYEDDDDDDDAAMSAYVSELERILMGDDDGDGDVAAACPGGDRTGDICVDDHRIGDICLDDYLFGDDVLAGAGHFGAIAAAADGAGRDAEEEEEVHLAAHEDDEVSSRKRERHKRINKGTTMVIPWGELEVAAARLARIQVPAPRLPAVALVRCM